MPTISGVNMSYTYGSSEYNELIADADMLPDIEEIQEMMFDETMECINGYDIIQGNCDLCDYYMSIDDHIFINFLNEELEHRKEESEDGKTRKYDFTKPFV